MNANTVRTDFLLEKYFHSVLALNYLSLPHLTKRPRGHFCHTLQEHILFHSMKENKLETFSDILFTGKIKAKSYLTN